MNPFTIIHNLPVSKCPIGFPKDFPNTYSTLNLLKVGASVTFGLASIGLLYKHGNTAKFYDKIFKLNLGITTGLCGYQYYKQINMNQRIINSISLKNLEIIRYGIPTGESTADLNLPAPTHFYHDYPSGPASDFVKINYVDYFELFTTFPIAIAVNFPLIWMLSYNDPDSFLSMTDEVLEKKMKVLSDNVKKEVSILKSKYPKL